jgi:predicted metalloprotease
MLQSMRWTRGGRSSNLEDRRGSSSSGGGGFGGGAGILMLLFSKFGLPGLLIGGAVLYFAGGFSGGGGETEQLSGAAPASESAGEKEMVDFVSFVLDDAQSTFTSAFQGAGQSYRPARLVLFRQGTRSGCGFGESAMGPFYCPADERVYIDLSFYEDMRKRFGAPGDFAQAYVIAHEIGHHVQNLLGDNARVKGDRQGAESAAVRLELQADCYAGVWGASARQRDLLEQGDLEEALRAATAIGDDALQKQSQGRVVPDSFTHGTSEQRVRWFKRGFESGNLKDCDTFSASSL